jgi:hypothetical protein
MLNSSKSFALIKVKKYKVIDLGTYITGPTIGPVGFVKPEPRLELQGLPIVR